MNIFDNLIEEINKQSKEYTFKLDETNDPEISNNEVHIPVEIKVDKTFTIFGEEDEFPIDTEEYIDFNNIKFTKEGEEAVTSNLVDNIADYVESDIDDIVKSVKIDSDGLTLKDFELEEIDLDYNKVDLTGISAKAYDDGLDYEMGEVYYHDRWTDAYADKVELETNEALTLTGLLILKK